MQKKIPLIFLGFLFLFSVCSSCEFGGEKAFKLKQFTCYPNRVVSGYGTVKAINNGKIISNYMGDNLKWKLSDSLQLFPTFTCSSPLLNAVYQFSLEKTLAIDNNTKLLPLCYHTLSALAITNPEKSKELLLQKVKQFNISENNIYPVNLQHLWWGMAAWKVYKITGEKAWLRKIFTIEKRAISTDLNITWNYEKQLFRGSVDVQNSMYPSNFTSVDIWDSYSLRTQILYARNLQLLIRMGKILDRDVQCYEQLLLALKKSIVTNFWLPKQKFFASCIYGYRKLFKIEERDVLAEIMGIVWNVFEESEQQKLVQSIPLFDFGVPNKLPIYLNENAETTALTQAYYTKAAAKTNCFKSVDFGLNYMLRATALPLKGSNSWNIETGKFINNKNTESGAASMLSLYYDVLLGIRLDTDKMFFSPFIPKEIGKNDSIVVKGLKYRNAEINIKIIGYGNNIESCTINQNSVGKPKISSTAKGLQQVVVYMNNKLPKQKGVKIGKSVVRTKQPTLQLKENTVFWHQQKDVKQYNLYRNGKLWKNVTDTFFTDTVTKPYWLAVQTQGATEQKSLCSKEVLLRPFAYRRELDATMFYADTTKSYVLFQRNFVYNFKLRVPREGIYRIALWYNAKSSEKGCITRSFWKSDNYLGAYVFSFDKMKADSIRRTNFIEIEVFKGNNEFSVTNEKFNWRNNRYPDKLKITKIEIIRVE